MNKLLEKMYSVRQGHYCHCVEVESVYDLESIAEQILDQEENEFGQEVIIEFLESLEVYCLNDFNEESVYAFSFKNHILSL